MIGRTALAALPAEQIAFPWPERFAGKAREDSKAPILTMDTGDTTEAIVAAIRRAYDGNDSPVKRIARLANSNTRSAENWWRGKNLPDVVHFLRLAAQIPELKAEVRRLIGMESDINPEFDAALANLVGLAARMKAGRK